MVRRLCNGIVGLAGVVIVAASSMAAEVWQVTDGRTTVRLEEQLIRDLGLNVVDVDQTAPNPSALDVQMEGPYVSFAVRRDTDLEFRVDGGILVPNGIEQGAIRHAGGFALVDKATGRRLDFTDFSLDFVRQNDDLGGGTVFALRTAHAMTAGLDASNAAIRFDRTDGRIAVGGLELRISADFANAIGRPELAGRGIGMATMLGEAQHVRGEQTVERLGGFSDCTAGETRDVKLGILEGIDERGHLGSTSGVSMATTSCNVGDCDVRWYAAMQEDHPLIAMQLYREMDDKFEQIGISWLKHGFFALSNSQCTPCQNPSGGDFLGVGCSDTYGAGNNSDRFWLGPRNEVDPYLGTWECEGSWFSDFQNDCVRRNGGGSFDPVEHRLLVDDSELGLPGATYYYEAYYVVEGDDNKWNNFGSRICTMSFSGGSGDQWDFSTPFSANPLVEGPAIQRWGDVSVTASIDGNDGDFIVNAKATDIGGGMWHYEYALFNFDSERMARSFSIPIDPGANVQNIEFHDWDEDSGNDWAGVVTGAKIEFSTDTFAQDPNANALDFGMLFNVRFDVDAEVAIGNGTMGLFKPGTGGDQLLFGGLPIPSTTVSVEPGVSPVVTRLAKAAPNPLAPFTTIGFDLSESGRVRLDIFDAAGRQVKRLYEGHLTAGTRSMDWDGTNEAGSDVPAGVYYYRLTAGGFSDSKSVVVVR